MKEVLEDPVGSWGLRKGHSRGELPACKPGGDPGGGGAVGWQGLGAAEDGGSACCWVGALVG